MKQELLFEVANRGVAPYREKGQLPFFGPRRSSPGVDIHTSFFRLADRVPLFPFRNVAAFCFP